MSAQWSCRGVVIVVAGVCVLGSPSSYAQSVEEFYRGKTLSMIIGYPPGGSNDVYARAVARHIGKHIPGNPSVVPRNMPGAGSLVAANHIFNVAAKDGTVLGLVAPTAPLEEKLGAPNIKFKAGQFNWIGRIAPGVNITFVMSRTPVKTIKDAFEKEAILAASGRSSTVAIYPSVLNNVVGTKFKLVLGYEGSVAAMLAMERGEVDGHSTSVEAVRSVHPDWITERKVNILVQHALKRHPEFPDVPTSVELGRTPEQVQILRVIANATEVGKLVLSPPDQPAERVTALRRAFDAMVKDPDFIAELKAMRVDLDPMPGEELQALVKEVGSVPPAIIDKVKAIYPLK